MNSRKEWRRSAQNSWSEVQIRGSVRLLKNLCDFWKATDSRPAGGFKSDVDTKAMASDPAQFLAVCVLDSFTKLSFSLSYDFCIFSPWIKCCIFSLYFLDSLSAPSLSLCLPHRLPSPAQLSSPFSLSLSLSLRSQLVVPCSPRPSGVRSPRSCTRFPLRLFRQLIRIFIRITDPRHPIVRFDSNTYFKEPFVYSQYHWFSSDNRQLENLNRVPTICRKTTWK